VTLKINYIFLRVADPLFGSIETWWCM